MDDTRLKWFPPKRKPKKVLTPVQQKERAERLKKRRKRQKVFTGIMLVLVLGYIIFAFINGG